MTSLFEAFPAELLNAILTCVSPEEAKLDLRDLTSPSCTNFPWRSFASLNQTSRTLHLHSEPFLYGSVISRDVAMHRALCSGNVETIRRALEYGASPSTTGQMVGQWYRQVSTLKLALRSGQFETVRFLMEQYGARLCDAVDLHPRSLMRLLLKPWNEEFLRKYLAERTSNTSEPAKEKPGNLWGIPLVPIIRSVPVDVLRLLLDHGARPNHIYQHCSNQSMSPLSAAIIARSPDHFRTLLGLGANINGQDVKGERKPMHIPVIAAASDMKDEAGIAMMQMCLDHGADINRPCHIDTLPRPRFVGQRWDAIPHVCTTALLTYLDSIDSWPADYALDEHTTRPSRPLDVVNFFVKNGADTVSPPLRPVPRPEQYRHGRDWRQELYDRTWEGPSSAIEILLDRWGLEQLASPDFFQVLRLLIQHGAARPFMARILVKYEGNGPEIVSNWKRLLNLLMTDLKQSDISLDMVLRRVIGDKGGLLNQPAHRRWLGRGEVGRASIDALITAGADINAHVKPSQHEAIKPWAYTSLIEFCSLIVHTDQLYSDLHDHADGHPCAHSLQMEGIYREWLSFLYSRGADPDLRDPDYPRDRITGLSAIDILEHPVRSGRTKDGGSMEKHMMRLVAALRGTSEITECKGEREPYQEIFGLVGSRWRHPSGVDCLAKVIV